jgi:hypothetical protein
MPRMSERQRQFCDRMQSYAGTEADPGMQRPGRTAPDGRDQPQEIVPVPMALEPGADIVE